MSAVAQPQSFPWHVIRGPAAFVACYVVLYNVHHQENHGKWWVPFGLALVAFVTGLFDKYDKPMIGSPWRLNNATWFALTLGIPAAAAVGGILIGDWRWIVGGLIVFCANLLLHVGFREQGLPGTVIIACLLMIAAP